MPRYRRVQDGVRFFQCLSYETLSEDDDVITTEGRLLGASYKFPAVKLDQGKAFKWTNCNSDKMQQKCNSELFQLMHTHTHTQNG